MCRTRKPAAIRAQLHPQARARSRVQGHSIKGCLPLHLKRQLQLIRLHLNRSTGHQRAGLAMLSKALEDLCSPAIAAPVMRVWKHQRYACNMQPSPDVVNGYHFGVELIPSPSNGAPWSLMLFYMRRHLCLSPDLSKERKGNSLIPGSQLG